MRGEPWSHQEKMVGGREGEEEEEEEEEGEREGEGGRLVSSHL